MSYYAIIPNGEIAISDNRESLNELYKNTKSLPDDYYERKYIVRSGELVIDVEGETKAALAELDAQYDRDKADIMNYYTQAVFAGDEEEQTALKIEMAEIDAQYIEDRKALEGED